MNITLVTRPDSNPIEIKPATTRKDTANFNIGVRPFSKEDYVAAAAWAKAEIEKYNIPVEEYEFHRLGLLPTIPGRHSALFEIDGDNALYRTCIVTSDGKHFVTYKAIKNYRASKKMWSRQFSQWLLNGVAVYLQYTDNDRLIRLYGD
jgi:hypothetical protein